MSSSTPSTHSSSILVQKRRSAWKIAIFLIAAVAVFSVYLVSTRGFKVFSRLYTNQALYNAVKNHDIGGATAALNQGADPNVSWSGGMRGGTPLMWAVVECDAPMVKLLIQRGANVNQHGPQGATALMWCNDVSVARELLDLGADPNARDNNRWTAMEYARDRRNTDMIRLMSQRHRFPPN